MINVCDYNNDPEPFRGFEVWSDPEGGLKDGRCVGAGFTKLDALWDAFNELHGDLQQLKKLILEEMVEHATLKKPQPEPDDALAKVSRELLAESLKKV